MALIMSVVSTCTSQHLRSSPTRDKDEQGSAHCIEGGWHRPQLEVQQDMVAEVACAGARLSPERRRGAVGARRRTWAPQRASAVDASAQAAALQEAVPLAHSIDLHVL